MKLTRTERAEMKAIARGEPHALRPRLRYKIRDRLQALGLIAWWVDPNANARTNRSQWMLTTKAPLEIRKLSLIPDAPAKRQRKPARARKARR